VVLVADAAGADPLIGEGIAFALGYGAIAAGAVIDAFAREDFAYSDYAARVLASDYGKLLNYRVTEAKRLYRQPNPLVVPSFMPGLNL